MPKHSRKGGSIPHRPPKSPPTKGWRYSVDDVDPAGAGFVIGQPIYVFVPRATLACAITVAGTGIGGLLDSWTDVHYGFAPKKGQATTTNASTPTGHGARYILLWEQL